MDGKNVTVFIDESGELGERGSNHLVVCALWVEDTAILERLMKKIRRQKRFGRFLKKTKELHASSSGDEFRTYVLSEIGRTEGIHAHAVILDKKRLYSSFLKTDKHKLYNYVSGFLAKNWSISHRVITVHIDKSKGKQLLQEDFNRYFADCIKRAGTLTSCHISHSYSHAWHGLQFVDFISWALFRKVESGDARFFTLVEHKTGISFIWQGKSSGTQQH